MSAVAAIPATPLHAWTAAKLGLHPAALTPPQMAAFQLTLLNETLVWARQRSSFYRKHLAPLSTAPLTSLDALRDFPFTTPAHLARDPGLFVCVTQDQIRHIVTLHTSGTSSPPKRVFFTAADLEPALDFFAHGVSTIAAPGDRMLIALPGEHEDSVGAQLARGIARSGVIPVPCGLFTDPAPALALLEQHRAAALIGLPVPILALAHHAEATGSTAFRDLRSIVLCSDHVPLSLLRALRRRTNADVFEHYGMTEMGLGGGIDCAAHAGYHLRESDLLFEIIDPLSGDPVPEGQEGEIVFTTLTRRGMPLIRYRTGDLSRFLPGPCACGAVLRRLDRVRNRIDSFFPLGTGGALTQSALDQALFAIDGIVDFAATLIPGELRILARRSPVAGPRESHLLEALFQALSAIEPIRLAQLAGALHVAVRLTEAPLPAPGPKRTIHNGGDA